MKPSFETTSETAITLKLTDGRKFIMADVERKESPKGSGYYNFQFQAK